MNWDHARRLLHLGHAGDPSGTFATDPTTSGSRFGSIAGSPAIARAASLCVASGKGGTGKSVVTASLGDILARHGRTLIVDADLGVGNAHILQDVTPELSFVEVVDG